jgi:hypothetical protein
MYITLLVPNLGPIFFLNPLIRYVYVDKLADALKFRLVLH